MTDDSSFPSFNSYSAFRSCLPPRKRLLVGLKHINGFSCSPASAPGLHTSGASCNSWLQDFNLGVDPLKAKTSDNVPCENQQQQKQDRDEADFESADPNNQRLDHTVPNHRKRARDGEAGVPSFLGTSVGAIASDQELIDERSLHYEKNAEAAKIKAAIAADAAAKARANALDKATVSVKAACAARAALDGAVKGALEENWEVQISPRESAIKFNVNKELLADDDELAPQLCCVINESPWVCCSLIPSPPPLNTVNFPTHWQTMFPESKQYKEQVEEDDIDVPSRGLKEFEQERKDKKGKKQLYCKSINRLSKIFRSKRNGGVDRRTSSLLYVSPIANEQESRHT